MISRTSVLPIPPSKTLEKNEREALRYADNEIRKYFPKLAYNRLPNTVFNFVGNSLIVNAYNDSTLRNIIENRDVALSASRSHIFESGIQFRFSFCRFSAVNEITNVSITSGITEHALYTKDLHSEMFSKQGCLALLKFSSGNDALTLFNLGVYFPNTSYENQLGYEDDDGIKTVCSIEEYAGIKFWWTRPGSAYYYHISVKKVNEDTSSYSNYGEVIITEKSPAELSKFSFAVFPCLRGMESSITWFTHIAASNPVRSWIIYDTSKKAKEFYMLPIQAVSSGDLSAIAILDENLEYKGLLGVKGNAPYGLLFHPVSIFAISYDFDSDGNLIDVITPAFVIDDKGLEEVLWPS